jgi:alkylation response protein AidB-like acyl-CoA dehydrogenase
MTAPISVDEFRSRVRGCLSAHVPLKAPGELELQITDEGAARDRAIQRAMWDGRIAGVTVPMAYGGLGLGLEHQEVFREEAAPYRMPEISGNSFNIALPTLLAHGSEDLKREFIPQILNGNHIWCQLLSEPSGGSDLAGALTRATADGDSWVINGAKIWTTAGNYSDYGVLLARTDPGVPKHAGLTMFVLPMRAPGVTVLPLRRLDNQTDFCQEFFADVRVPAGYVIGEVNDGWRVATTLMLNERTGLAQGWSQGGLKGEGEDIRVDLNRDLLAEARAQGRSDDPETRALIGEAWTLSAVQSRTVARISTAIAGGQLPGSAAAILKAMAATHIVRLGEIGQEIAGNDAVAWPRSSQGLYGVARLTSRGYGIGGGSTEMQLNTISERILGLPRDPTNDRDVPFNQLRHNTMTALPAQPAGIDIAKGT